MPVLLDYEQDIAFLTLSRPEALNALNRQTLQEISTALDEVAQSKARALVLLGAHDKAFCAGADITELLDSDARHNHELARFGQLTFAKLDGLCIPSVAVIHGYAFGGGLELAMACMFRVATPQARLGLPEVKLGLIPGYGGTQRLPRLVGESRALEIIMSGRTIEATEAERIGLVNRVVASDHPRSIGAAFVRPFIGYSLCALRYGSEAVRRGSSLSLLDGLCFEADMFALAFESADAKEGIRAFLDKRPAAFIDR